jgi:DNA polymerase III subunit gamma/tau
MTNQLSINLRPRKFSEVYNQKAVVEELKERVKTGNWPTAMLLKGPSGTAKTTVGQIIAMTINCSKLDENNDPCGVCPSCRSIIEERFDRDTLVLDGSTLGVKDDVVSFGQLADMAPMYDKKRVLIIEESDQLSTSAKNALHKILEKPRSHVHFILLSMVSNGLPVSIQSRCQVYNFKYFTLKEIAIGLKEIMEKLNLWNSEEIPDSFKMEGILCIASASVGSFREALQYFEKCLVGKYYTKESIRENLGIIDNSTINELINKFLNTDKTFFSAFNTIEYNDFFNLAYTTLTNAYMYHISGFIENEWFEDVIKGISKHPRLKESIILFDDIYKDSKPYLKKSFLISKLSQFFVKNLNYQTTTTTTTVEDSFYIKQALLDAEARARAISSKNDPQTTNLGQRATRIPRS